MISTFSRLTVLRHAEGRAPRFVLCRCVCGAEKVASLSDIKRGMVKSCGCLHREASAENGRTPRVINDLTGRRFGMLTVVSRAPNNRHGRTTWRCACDCGEGVTTSGNHLTQGNTASCGCARRDKLAVRPADRRAWSNAYVQRRYRNDPRYALNRRALHLIHRSLKSRGGAKSGRWGELVGYTVDALEKRLRRTIPRGFTWADFMIGTLEIDHKTPLAAFNFTSAADHDFRRAWALKNLRLLPATENRDKSDSLAAPFQPSLI